MKKCVFLLPAIIFIAVCCLSGSSLKVKNELLADDPVIVNPVPKTLTKPGPIIIKPVSLQVGLQQEVMI